MTSTQAIDLSGKIFGRWTVMQRVGSDSHRSVLYGCLCLCGTYRIVKSGSLRSGASKSCGCLKSEMASKRSGDKNGHWKGGRYVNDAGYIMVYLPEHKRAAHNGYVREHILMAEKALCNELPDNAQVHNYGDVGDNSKIIICENQEYHHLLHMRQRAIEACGNPNWRKCKFCKQYDDPNSLHIKHRPPQGWEIFHNACRNEYEKQRIRGNGN